MSFRLYMAQIPALPSIRDLILDDQFHFPEPEFVHLQNTLKWVSKMSKDDLCTVRIVQVRIT